MPQIEACDGFSTFLVAATALFATGFFVIPTAFWNWSKWQRYPGVYTWQDALFGLGPNPSDIGLVWCVLGAAFATLVVAVRADCLTVVLG